MSSTQIARQTEQQPGPSRSVVLAWLAQRSLTWHIVSTVGLTFVVGVADYLTGFERSFLAFYLIPIAWATWFVGRWYGITISLLSFAIWLIGDLAAAPNNSHFATVGWNALVGLISFIVVVSLLANIRQILSHLEGRVLSRTAALRQEMAVRARLEREVMEVSEREQIRIGRDLHDGLGQHLTGAALTCKLLCESMAERDAGELAQADRVVKLIEEAIETTRSLAHGLSPVALDADGLQIALQNLRSFTAGNLHLECDFQADEDVLVENPVAATHLYRIAQEAVTNATRHGNATHISIQLKRGDNHAILIIADNGIGIPDETERGNGGLGLRTMAHRAELIGAEFQILRGVDGGTVVECSLPLGGAVPAA